jgi:CRISPR-associated protein Csm5
MDRFYDIYSRSYLAAFEKGASYHPAGGEHIMYLGGGSGFATKTAVYPMYDSVEERRRSVKTVQKLMLDLTPANHKHRSDFEKYGVSPHTLKVAVIGGRRYEMGLCRVDIVPE